MQFTRIATDKYAAIIRGREWKQQRDVGGGEKLKLILDITNMNMGTCTSTLPK